MQSTQAKEKQSAVQRKDKKAAPASSAGRSVQKKSVQKDAWPGGPSGDKIERINFSDADSIISSVKSQSRGMDHDANGVNDNIRTLFSGDYFYGSAYWSSGWVDDGWSDTWNLGLADIDCKVELSLTISNPRPKAAGVDSTGTAGGTGSSSNTTSTASTAGGKVTGGVGGSGKPAAGGEVNVSQTDTTSTTVGNTGSRTDSAAYKNQRYEADVMVKIKVSYNATLPGVSPSADGTTVKAGTVTYLRKNLD